MLEEGNLGLALDGTTFPPSDFFTEGLLIAVPLLETVFFLFLGVSLRFMAMRLSFAKMMVFCYKVKYFSTSISSFYEIRCRLAVLKKI
ncbi:MAG: hypothetical protein EBS07_11075 [Sphingobacteriia bacterium]|nr:hypothetical protein [Sphingobacteriia bacterium]